LFCGRFQWQQMAMAARKLKGGHQPPRKQKGRREAGLSVAK
jgi:hypothetical protein